ncbi:hypothetical protein EI969_19990 [Pseudomonas sp. PB101]|nr:hypothetical protein [Pseudomonas sp. PB101]
MSSAPRKKPKWKKAPSTRSTVLPCCWSRLTPTHRNSPDTPRSLWERACSRKRSVIQHLCRLILSFREQARSHIGRSKSVRFRFASRVALSPCPHQQNSPASSSACSPTSAWASA